MNLPLFALIVVWTATFLGAHLVWTHLWAVTTFLLHTLYSSNSSSESSTSIQHLLGSAVMTGVAMTCSWYTTLVLQRDADFIGRAVTGWSKWIIEDVLASKSIALAAAGTKNPFTFENVPLALRLGYHAGDLAVHFFPTLWLLQRHASVVAAAPAAYCCVGFLVTRAWCLHVSVHTLKFDCNERRLRRVPHPSPPSPFVVDGALNWVYGLEPHLPPRVYVAAYRYVRNSGHTSAPTHSRTIYDTLVAPTHNCILRHPLTPTHQTRYSPTNQSLCTPVTLPLLLFSCSRVLMFQCSNVPMF